MIAYFTEHHASFWFVLGFALLAIEALILGMTTGVLLFAAVGALLTGGVLYFNLAPHTWMSGIALFAVFSVLSTAVLWKPLKRLQNNTPEERDSSSDFIGLEFRLDDDLSRTTESKTRYSGISWRVVLDEESEVDSIAAGELVAVASISAGLFRVIRV